MLQLQVHQFTLSSFTTRNESCYSVSLGSGKARKLAQLKPISIHQHFLPQQPHNSPTSTHGCFSALQLLPLLCTSPLHHSCPGPGLGEALPLLNISWCTQAHRCPSLDSSRSCSLVSTTMQALTLIYVYLWLFIFPKLEEISSLRFLPLSNQLLKQMCSN